MHQNLIKFTQSVTFNECDAKVFKGESKSGVA